MAEAHSKYSASGFEAVMLCPGKPVMEQGLPDRGSKYADEGTAAHAVFELAILNDRPAAAYIGRRIPMKEGPPRTVEVTLDMVEHVQTALDQARRIVGDGMLLSEQRVNYSRALGVDEDEAWGTADVIGANGDELVVADLKYGMGVEVFAEENPQMMLYGLGALAAVDETLGPFSTVRLAVLQPRIKNEPSEWVVSVADLKAWAANYARNAVAKRQEGEVNHPVGHVVPSMTQTEWEQMYLRPNEKSCKFCRAKATCPALRDEAAVTVFETKAASPDEFDSLAPAERAKHSSDEWLAGVLGKADMIEDYLKAVRAEVEARLLEGKAIPGFKIVQGRRGNRKWADEAEAALALGGAGDDLYEPRAMKSPAAVEKILKKTWPVLHAKLPALVTQSDGAMHVAPVSDPRPALTVTPVVDDFAPVTADFA